MNKLNQIIITATLIMASQAQAANHMLVMGGGGEPAGPTTIFDSTMAILGNSVRGSNWQYSVSFDGGHADTDRLIGTNFPNSPKTDFTAANYNQMIQNYKTKILAGEITSADQLMVVIDSHGASNTSVGPTADKSHQISVIGGAAGDLNTLQGSATVNLDALQELINLTSARGIKLGIVDLSCHSGNTLKLKAPNTCIITSSGPNHFGYASDTTFGGQFFSQLKPGMNLEQAFINARSVSTEPAYPMISTGAGEQVVSEIYEDITPFLYAFDTNNAHDKLGKYLMSLNTDALVCKYQEQFTDLITKINNLQSSLGPSSRVDTTRLVTLLSNYKADQDKALATMIDLGGTNLGKRETFTAPVMVNNRQVKMESVTLDWATIARSNPDDTLAYFRSSLATFTTAREKAQAQANIDIWTKVKDKKAEILAAYPTLTNFRDDALAAMGRIQSNYSVTSAIAVEERKIFNELYRQRQIVSPEPNNPCKQMVF